MANFSNGTLNNEKVKTIVEEYHKDKRNAIIRHSLSRNPLSEVIYDSSSVLGENPAFSIEVKTLPVANQKASGRCWIFAGLNVLREIINKKLKMSKFELSQNYLSLYDKIEKANFALESIIKLVEREHDDRLLSFLLKEPVSDGGQWDMFVNLVEKYGLLPQSAFPETYQSNNTRELDAALNARIRGFASIAHKLYVSKNIEEIRVEKDKAIEEIYRMFLNAFGVPPEKFLFEYVDEKGKYHNEGEFTPHSFFEKYVGNSTLDEYQSIINSPTKDKPFFKNFTIDYLGNVLEGRSINHLNLPMDRLKELIIAQLKDGDPVWFGSDVSFYRDRQGFAWDDSSMDYSSTLGFSLEFDKGDMLDYWNSAMNHAMVITGVNLDASGKPNRYKIENSWGDENGLKGYFVMSASWFDKFVYQAVIKRKYLNENEKEAIRKEPIHLNPWDPMGTLAD